MGTYFRQMDGYFEFSAEKDLPEQPKQEPGQRPVISG